MRILLEDVYKKAVNFLNREKFEYIIIGGIAAGTLGEPRVTGDIDIDISLEEEKVSDFLKKAKRGGFKVDETRCKRQAFRRKKTVRLFNTKAFFPTPEDLILLKIIPARAQDLLDARNVLIRHKGKLDLKYLRTWARRLSDQAQDMRILNELRKLLSEEGSKIRKFKNSCQARILK